MHRQGAPVSLWTVASARIGMTGSSQFTRTRSPHQEADRYGAQRCREVVGTVLGVLTSKALPDPIGDSVPSTFTVVARRAAAIAFAVSAMSTAVIATPALAASTDTAIIDCAGKPVSEPTSIVITCADAGVMINKITWSAWNTDGATGTGVLTWNTCLPKTCIAGIIRRYPVRITLSGLGSTPNAHAFTTIDLAFPKGGPAGLESGRYSVTAPVR